MKASTALSEALSGMAREIARGPGPEKWCKTCGRKHPRRSPCSLVTTEVEASSGRKVTRRVQKSRVY